MNSDRIRPEAARPMSRRTLLRSLQALGIGVVLGPLAAPYSRATVERGSPQQLPLDVVADLGLQTPATVDDEPADLAVLTLGGMEVASGLLVATDGLLLEGTPFAARVEAGRYPVQIVLARLTSGEERVALLQLKLADRPAARWVVAAPEGAEPAAEDDDDPEFEVESGVACLIDAGAMAAWRAELASDNAALQALERVLRENRRPIWTWARVRAAGAAGVLVTAGFGGGSYVAYWGLDAAGERVSLVVDFDLLDWAGLPPEEPVEA